MEYLSGSADEDVADWDGLGSTTIESQMRSRLGGAMKLEICVRLAFCATVFLNGLVTHAQTTSSSVEPTSDVQFEEIVVTAQKRSEHISDVPMSITAVTGEQLRAQGITEVSDLDRVVPGFSYRPSVYNTPVYTIRGVGFFENSAAVAPTVSVYVDQVPLPFSVMTEGAAMDIERVEVLKGPQGTLFGQNSTGGAINYIANKPTLAPAAGLDVGYGNFNTFRSDGFISGPVIDSLTARLAFSTVQGGDWQESQTRDDTLGKREFTSTRLLLDWAPSGTLKFEMNANGWIDHSDTQAAQFVLFSAIKPTGYQDVVPALQAYTPAPNDPRIADWDPNVSLQRDDYLYQTSVRGDWTINDNATLTSITAYSGLRQIAPTDSDGTSVDNFFRTLNVDIHSFSQELRLSGQNSGDRFKWMLGANYENDTTADKQFTTTDATNDGVGPKRYFDYYIENDQHIETSAAFGSLDYALTSQLSAQGSVRYTKSKNTFNGCLKDAGDGELATAFSQIASHALAPGACVTLEPPPSRTPLSIVTKSLDQDNVSWHVGLSWKPAVTSLVYGNVTKGYKAGSFPTLAALTPDQFDPITQESLLAYELGFKQEWIPARIQFTGAAFYYDYRDKQLIGYKTTAFGNLPGFISIPKSRVVGGEGDVAWKPIRPLTVTLGATYVSTLVQSQLSTNSPFGQVVDIAGEAFPDTPNWQITGDTQYKFDLTDSLDGYVGSGGEYRTKTSAAFGGGPYFEMPAYGLLDLRAGVESKGGRWTLTLWGRNVTDRFYVLNVSHVTDTVARVAGQPATYGVTFGMRY